MCVHILDTLRMTLTRFFEIKNFFLFNKKINFHIYENILQLNDVRKFMFNMQIRRNGGNFPKSA